MRADTGRSTVDAELVALLAGIKPAIRLAAAPDEASEMAARYRARGLAVVAAAELVSIGYRPTALLYVARAASDALLVRDAEAAVLPARGRERRGADVDAHRDVGRRLGFPVCCVDAFCARLERGVDRLDARGPSGLAEDYVVMRDAWVPAPDARLNHLLVGAGWKLVSFYPCRYDCATAVRYAAALVEAIGRHRPDAARQLVDALSRPIALAPSNARAIVTRGADGTITAATAVTSANGDVAFAASLVGARAHPDGAIVGTGDPAAWVVPFGPGAAAGRRDGHG